MQFQVGANYRNRTFEYRVLSIGDEKLQVLTSKGEIREVSRAIQSRILENMECEERRAKALRERGAYEIHCWRCTSYISSFELSRCHGCCWYVCRQCVACGCGYYGRWAMARVDFAS